MYHFWKAMSQWNNRNISEYLQNKMVENYGGCVQFLINHELLRVWAWNIGLIVTSLNDNWIKDLNFALFP